MKPQATVPSAAKAARRLMQHAHAFEVVQDGRIYIEKINGPFLYVDRGAPADVQPDSSSLLNAAGSKNHDSGTFVRSRNPAQTSLITLLWSTVHMYQHQ